VSATAASSFPPGGLRVSDADRDRAISELSDHFQAGRLTAEEMDERSGLALRARTGNDLKALLDDLPLAGPPVTQPGHDIRPLRPRYLLATIAVVVLALAAIVALVAQPGHSHGWGGLAAPLIAAAVVLRVRLARRGGRGRGM
jgi:hypothetical protein